MNLAVLLYRNTDNPQNLPDEWPAECVELGDVTTMPGPTWQLMTRDEYDLYREQHQHLYDAWLIDNPKPTVKAPDPLAIIADLQAQIDALKTQIGAG